MWIRISLLVYLSLHVGTSIGDCDWNKVTTDFAVCSAEDEYDDFSVEDLIYPKPSCNHYIEYIEYVSFSTSVGRGDVDVKTGDQLQLYCEAKARIEGYTVTMWLCQESSDTLAQCLCPQTTAKSEGTLYPIKYVQTRDSMFISLNYTMSDVSESSSDRYYCLVQLSFGRHVHGFAEVNVNVRDVHKPEIVLGPKNTTVVLGQESKLTCQATGFPDVNYTWFKDGELLVENNSTRFTIIRERTVSNLYYNSTLQEDAGNYVCHVANLLGIATSEGAFLQVNTSTVTVRPAINTEVNLKLPVGIGVGAGTIAMVAMVTIVVVYRHVMKKQEEILIEQEGQPRPFEVNIERELDMNNFVLKVDGLGGDLTCNFMGGVNVGGADLADRIEALQGVEENIDIPDDEFQGEEDVEYDLGNGDDQYVDFAFDDEGVAYEDVGVAGEEIELGGIFEEVEQ
ncbi:vascular endothelial growth factor receptor 2-like [Ptychodera flava]|uniref:vascular endothelial growth factor receptor 2-like n=1 Tax=Ptychodera flava TaxID=63121 RepID=UPI00396A1982